MPAQRITSRRRKSSHNITYTPAKPGIYGAPARPAPNVTFAPNVTPVSYTEPDPDDDPSNPLSSLTSPDEDDAAGPHVKALRAQIYPESEQQQTGAGAPQKRKRTPPGKRPSQGYIPRPPNAFMLFRAAFVKQRHVPGSIETNHGSLSKIIGTCWRGLPLEEKRVWEKRAKEEKAAHKVRFPDYRFRPVHNKNKAAATKGPNAKSDLRSREKQPSTAEEEQRCEDISQFIMEGKSGEELEAAIRDLDRSRRMERQTQQEYEYDFESAESRRTSLDFGAESRNASPGALHMPASLHLPFGVSNAPFHAQSFGNHQHAAYQRRPSSVPLPNDWFANSGPFLGAPAVTQTQAAAGIALPTVPSFISRPASPVGTISRFNHQHSHSFHGQASFQPEQFSNPFNQQQQAQNNFNFPSSSQFPAQPQQTQHLFHPSPVQAQFMNIATPRGSLGLGQRRASSAQAMLMRSWTMPVSMSGFDYGMDMDMDMNMSNGMMERDPSPLPDVDPALFADFSFGKQEPADSHSSSSSVHSKAPSPAARTPTLAPIDTSISPLAHVDRNTDSACPTSTSTSTSASTSASGSPAPSISDVLPEMSSMGMSNEVYAPLGGMYPIGGYADESMYGLGMGGDMMYGYDVDPVVSSQYTHTHSSKLNTEMPTPTASATEANFAQDLGDQGAYFEVTSA